MVGTTYFDYDKSLIGQICCGLFEKILRVNCLENRSEEGSFVGRIIAIVFEPSSLNVYVQVTKGPQEGRVVYLRLMDIRLGRRGKGFKCLSGSTQRKA